MVAAALLEALAKRRLLSRTRGRRGFSAEVVVRLLILNRLPQLELRRYWYITKTLRNLIYRKFTASGSPRWPMPKP